MALLSTAADVAEAKRLLAAELPARRAARLEVDQLLEAANRLAAAETGPGNDIARASLHLEGVRRALRLLGGLEAGVPDAQVWERVSPEARAALLLSDATVPLVSAAVTQGLDDRQAPPLLAIATAHANAASKLNAEERVVGNHDLVRVVRIVVGLCVMAIVAVGVVVGVTKLTAPPDLAAGLPFTTSSKMADCHPERNECGGYPMKALFHTLEEKNPWYQVDLGKPTAFSKMTIVNRGDMGEARAIPLVVELSDDGATWREVARKPEVFNTWKPDLGAQTARFVRLRVDRVTWFHLEAVRIHP